MTPVHDSDKLLVGPARRALFVPLVCALSIFERGDMCLSAAPGQARRPDLKLKLQTFFAVPRSPSAVPALLALPAPLFAYNAEARRDKV